MKVDDYTFKPGDGKTATLTAIQRKVDAVGSTIQTAPKPSETTTEPDEFDMKMPLDQQLAWEMVDGFRDHYVKLHGRRPRAGLVKKRFDRSLAFVRSTLAAAGGAS